MKTYTLFLAVVVTGMLSFSQSNNCVTPPNNLISWWKAEDNANDSEGNNNGTPNGASYGTGVVDKSFLFDGVNDVIVVPHSQDLDITNDITIEFWALQTVFNAENTVLCKGSEDAANTFSIRFLGQIFECVFKDTTGNDVVLGGPSFEDFQWHHYTYVRQGNQHQIYADGFAFGWMPFTNLPASSSGLPLTIGAQFNSQNTNYTNFFGGQIDEVAIYNRALSQAEIQSIYNAGANGKCSSTLNIEDDKVVDNAITLYPNPVIEELHVKLSKRASFNVSLINTNGAVLKRFENVSSALKIDMNDKASGLYFVSVQNLENYQNITYKVFKQ